MSKRKKNYTIGEIKHLTDLIIEGNIKADGQYEIVKSIRAEVSSLKEELEHALKVSGVDNVRTDNATVTVSHGKALEVRNPTAFMDYLEGIGLGQLVERKLNASALRTNQYKDAILKRDDLPDSVAVVDKDTLSIRPKKKEEDNDKLN